MDSEKIPDDSYQDGIYRVIKGLVRKPMRAFMEQLYGEQATRESATREVLEYVEILEYAAARRAEDQHIMATLLRRERQQGGWLITQVFMDKNNNLIRKGKGMLGRSIYVKRLDAELTDYFDQEESVVIELP
jgi:hypothetical protein